MSELESWIFDHYCGISNHLPSRDENWLNNTSTRTKNDPVYFSDVQDTVWNCKLLVFERPIILFFQEDWNWSRSGKTADEMFLLLEVGYFSWFSWRFFYLEYIESLL